MKTMFTRPLVLVAVLLSFSTVTKAQMYGTGMQGGMQACPYDQNIGDEAESVQDDIRERNEKITDLKEKLKDTKAKQQELNRKMERAKSEIERRGIQGDFLSKIIDHITEGRACGEYQGYANTGCGKKVTENGEFVEDNQS